MQPKRTFKIVIKFCGHKQGVVADYLKVKDDNYGDDTGGDQ